MPTKRGMPPGAFPNDPKDIFAALNRAKVRYLVVGGVAAIFHGVPRTTFDADVAVELELDNLRRLDKAVRDLGFSPRVPAPVTGLANARVRREWTTRKNMKVFSYIEGRKPFRTLDVMVQPLRNFARLYRDRLTVRYAGVAIPILPIDSLIQMKTAAGRVEDQMDVAYLRVIQQSQKTSKTR